ncbi:MAG: KEOPS complex subunit Pcc1 [Methanomethylophilus sp.]|jgi:KEOPS complex subunit Pcc1
MPDAVLRIEGPRAAEICSALAPEVRRDLLRTHAEIRMDGGDAVLTISASDTAAARAALNSYLECVAVAASVGEITEESK